jgi:hypothetical protein
MLKLYELNKPRPFCRIPLNPTARSAEKVNLALLVMSLTVTVSLSALVAAGKDYWTVCYELRSVLIEVTNERNEG